MNTQRLAQLQAFLEETPQDPFLLYALATEYLAGGALETAQGYFERLLQEHPGYLATYYHAALLYAELGLAEQAEAVFREGIARCEAAQEAKALRELRQAYQNFLFEQE
jgi:Tfp pilus assembly protein PilF